jgi:hypothetical protein
MGSVAQLTDTRPAVTAANTSGAALTAAAVCTLRRLTLSISAAASAVLRLEGKAAAIPGSAPAAQGPASRAAGLRPLALSSEPPPTSARDTRRSIPCRSTMPCANARAS